MSDADGDSTMHSSPSLPEDDEMFPDEALPHTPALAGSTHTIHNSTIASDLSPPNSQTTQQQSSSLAHGVNENGKRPLSLAGQQNAGGSASSGVGSSSLTGSGSGVHTDAETGYTWSKSEDQPGYEWKNTRAREEENRALETIIDKGLQIKTRYGDPLDPSVPAKAKR